MQTAPTSSLLHQTRGSASIASTMTRAMTHSVTHTVTHTVLVASMLAAVLSPAYGAERSNPLTLTIPSLPEDTPKLDVVDNDLAVSLLDAQMDQQTASSLPVFPTRGSSARHSSGGMASGQVSITYDDPQTPTRIAPAIASADNSSVARPAPPEKRVVVAPQQPTPAPILQKPTAPQLSTPVELTRAPQQMQVNVPASLPRQQANVPAVVYRPAAPTLAPMQEIDSAQIEQRDGAAFRQATVQRFTPNQQAKPFLYEFPVVQIAQVGSAAMPIAMPAPAASNMTQVATAPLQQAEVAQLPMQANAPSVAPASEVQASALQASEIQASEVPGNAVIASNERELSALAPAAGQASYTPASLPTTQETLSQRSKQIISRIPARMDSPKKTTGPIEIERGNTNIIAFSELNTELTAQHDSLGMSIEIRRPLLDVNEELKRAYDATVSGQEAIALASYERVLTVRPGNIDALYGKATLLHRAGAFEDARRFYEKVLRKDGDHREALNNFLSLVAEEAPAEALNALFTLQSKNPHFSPIPAQISHIYQKTGDQRSATLAMHDAYTLEPTNLTYALNLAILLDKQGARAQAAEYYQQLQDAHVRGANIPGNIQVIQERLTFLRSNRKL